MPLAKRQQQRHVALASKKSPTSSSVSKIPSHDPSLGIGVGAGALYMLISCHEEMKRLNKTVEQTENLVEELKQQLYQHHEDSPSLSCLGSHSVHSAEIRPASSQDLYASMDQMGQPPLVTRTYNMEEQVPAKRGMAKDQMAALAAELEAELELMELNMNAQEILSDQSLMHDASEVSSKGLQNSYYSNTSSHGTLEASHVGRPSAHLGASHWDCGVSPIELDYCLREVLDAQQQERILELEQLLKDTEAKLLAKEQQISSWKNHVNSLTNLFQPASESVTLYDNVVAAVPEVTKSTVELLHSFQDPPISTRVNYMESASGTDLLENVLKQETNLCSSSAEALPNNRSHLNRASYPSSLSKGSLDMVRVANCCWDQQGTGLHAPEFVIMKELDVHTAAQNSKSLGGQAGLETSDCMLPDGCGSEMLSIFNEHLDSLLVDVDGEDAPPSGGLHTSQWRTHLPLERDSSDVKHVVNSFMSKPVPSDDLDNRSSCEDMQRSLELKNEGLQIVTKGLRKSLMFHERLMEVKSPVLDKIRHYETLGGHVHGKRS